jgi:glycine/D-amino acid oxidase-like deaminating enzyme
MAAATLASRGRSVALLEKHGLGRGASSRNGGMVHPGFKVGPGALLKRYGDRGRQLYRASLDAFALVEETIRSNRIECDYVRTGHLYLAYKPDQVAHLEAEARLLTEQFGVGARVLDRDALASEIGSPLYYGALLYERSGGLHPAKYYAGLARRARDRDVRLYEQTPATAIERRPGGGFVVVTPRGRIVTRDVLLATNGYTDGLVPQ